RVRDRSKNGTIFEGERHESFELEPGETFRVGETTLVAITEPAKQTERRLRVLLGFSDHTTVDGALALGLRSTSVALIGEAGSRHADLAALLHSISTRRHRNLALPKTIEEIDAALSTFTGAIFVDATLFPRLDQKAPTIAR